jgi:hypothetical protein
MGRAFEEELRSLHRSRLILVHLLFLGFTVLEALMSYAIPHSEQDELVRPDKGTQWYLAVPFAENLLGALVLWRWRGIAWPRPRRGLDRMPRVLRDLQTKHERLHKNQRPAMSVASKVCDLREKTKSRHTVREGPFMFPWSDDGERRSDRGRRC